jgi:hypothetical protein
VGRCGAKNGVNKVLDAVRHSDRFTGHGAGVLVWVDNDRIRRALQLDPLCTKQTVIAAIQAHASQSGSGTAPLEIFLLEDNLEDLLSSVADRLDAALLAKARAKRLDARDILLDEIGRSRQLREALRANHGGFAEVSRFVASVAVMQTRPA